MKKAKPKRTLFVPRVVFEATFAGVVPVCVASADCTNENAGGLSHPSESSDATMPPPYVGVAGGCFGPQCGAGGGTLGGDAQPKIVSCSDYEGGIPHLESGVDDCPDAYTPARVVVGGPFCCVPLVAPSDGSVDASGAADGGDASAKTDVAAEASVPPDVLEAGEEQQGDSLAVADAAFIPDGDTG